MESPLIITGMHRSGTSLISSYLQRCGVDIGEELMAPAFDNPKGYFEDSFFVKIHRSILANNKTSMFIPEIRFVDQDICDEINRYAEKKTGLWGWKDPRTVIFLNCYQSIFPRGEYIFIFRHPYSAIRSLVTRGSDSEIMKDRRVAGRSWCWYNEKFYSFIRRATVIPICFFWKIYLNDLIVSLII